jgi:hypothetical protein
MGGDPSLCDGGQASTKSRSVNVAGQQAPVGVSEPIHVAIAEWVLLAPQHVDGGLGAVVQFSADDGHRSGLLLELAYIPDLGDAARRSN